MSKIEYLFDDENEEKDELADKNENISESLEKDDDEYISEVKVENLIDEIDEDNETDEYVKDTSAQDDANFSFIKEIPSENKEVKMEEPKEKAKKTKKKMKIWQKVILVLVILGLVGGSTLAYLLYGHYPNFREWLITTAMTTMNHQYLATWFYDDGTIQKVLENNYVKESGETTDTGLITFVDYDTTHTIYKNKYEKEILTKDEGNDLYKLININEEGLRGYLVAIYDPS